MRSYKELADYLSKGRNKNERPFDKLRNVRIIWLSDLEIVVKYHSTIILHFFKNGKVILDSFWERQNVRFVD